MILTKTVTICNEPKAVWAGLNDPEVLQACIPGCESLDEQADTSYKTRIGLKIGPLKSIFSGTLVLSDHIREKQIRLSGQGEDETAGEVRGTMLMKLAKVESGCDITYEIDASVDGKLSQIDPPFIEQAARSFVTTFFERFATIVSGRSPIPADEETKNDKSTEIPLDSTAMRKPPAEKPQEPAKSEDVKPDPPATAPADRPQRAAPKVDEPERSTPQLSPGAGVMKVDANIEPNSLSLMQKISTVGLGVSLLLIALGVLSILYG